MAKENSHSQNQMRRAEKKKLHVNGVRAKEREIYDEGRVYSIR